MTFFFNQYISDSEYTNYCAGHDVRGQDIVAPGHGIQHYTFRHSNNV
jgi:hypothetical protein